jgi:hypothetical protein
MDKKRCRQASLFVLSFIAQDSFLKSYFVKAYSNILKALKSEQEFSLTTNGILKIIENEIWDNKQQLHLASNPFAKSLTNTI